MSPPRPTWGHSKDHRPDLKQLVWILTVSGDGAVPITYQMSDGNTEDSTTHVATWDTCRAIAGRADFLYIGDRKLATRDNMDHIAAHGGRFLTVPRSRKEDESGRAWLAAGPIDWSEIARRPGRHKADPLERRHATFKGVIEAVPVQLKSDRRMDALGFCLYAALLTHALIERELRRAMAAAGIADLPLYYEDRACKSPTAARVLDLLEPLARTVVLHHGRVLAVQEPTLNPLQEQVLQFLGVPTSPYGAA